MLSISGSLSFPFASMPLRRRPRRVLADRNWGAKFSKSGSEVFMKVYPPSASHSSSSPPSSCFARSFFPPTVFHFHHSLALAPSLSDVRSLLPSSTVFSFVWPVRYQPPSICSYRQRTERVNPRSPSAGLEQKLSELHLFLSTFLPSSSSQVSHAVDRA